MEKIYELAIVGGGIAGYSAALTAKSLALDTLWLGEEFPGEKLLKAEYVRNYPGICGNGKEFARLLLAQAEAEGVLLTPARVDGVYALGDKFCLTEKGREYYARAVILASGVESKGTLKGEREFLGRGVSYCAVCDGALYKGKTVAAVLSSPKFAEEAEYLARFARKVICFCLYKDPAFRAENIEIAKDVPLALEGEKRVNALVCAHGKISVDGVFFLKNSAPPEAIAGGLKTEDGRVIVSRDLATNLQGLFAAGDITGRPYQYVKAAGEGCTAAYSAYDYLRKR